MKTLVCAAALLLLAACGGKSSSGAAAAPALQQATLYIQPETSSWVSATGTPQTYYVSLSPNGTTGTLTLQVDAVAVTGVAASTTADGWGATFTVTMATGTHYLTATYGGSSTFAAASATLPSPQIVIPNEAPTVTLAPNVNPAASGQQVTYQAHVVYVGASDAQVDGLGMVTFSDGATTLGSSTVREGFATCVEKTSLLTAGTHPIKAVFVPYPATPTTPQYSSDILPEVVQ